MANDIESAETGALPIEAILRTHLHTRLVALSGIGWPDLPVQIPDQDNQKKSRRFIGS